MLAGESRSQVIVEGWSDQIYLYSEGRRSTFGVEDKFRQRQEQGCHLWQQPGHPLALAPQG